MGTAQPSTTLLLTRHGQSTWNAEGRWQGQADPPLSKHGREQANAAAGRIGVTDAIVSSPQQRALDTALIISNTNGVGPVLIHSDLRERSAGAWSGLTHDDIEVQFPGWLATHRRPDDFEPDEALLARVLPVLTAIAEEQPGATVLVMCHGGIIRAMETHFGLPEKRIPNLSGRIMIIDEGGSIRLGDQIRFLDDEPVADGDVDRV